jgi:predicted 3-demethylubiquinone-9 3-methyltransferase (glyoxalase superfamily)
LEGTGYGAADLDALIDELSGAVDDAPEFEDKEFSNQYGVIVTCETEQEQEVVYNKLLADGYTVKVVVV